MSTITVGTTSNQAFSVSSDTTGNFVVNVNTTTLALTINTSGAFGVGTTPSYGTSGQVLTSNGSAAAPTWGTVATGAQDYVLQVNGASVAPGNPQSALGII